MENPGVLRVSFMPLSTAVSFSILLFTETHFGWLLSLATERHVTNTLRNTF